MKPGSGRSSSRSHDRPTKPGQVGRPRGTIFLTGNSVTGSAGRCICESWGALTMAILRTTTGGGSGVQISLAGTENLIVVDGVQVFSDDAQVITGVGDNDIFLSANSAIRTFATLPQDPAIELATTFAPSQLEIAETASVSSSGYGVIGREGAVSIVNFGTISAHVVAVDLFGNSNNLINYGDINATTNIGARLWQSATITNYGSIFGEAFGVVTRDGGGEVTNFGDIAGDTAVWLGGDNEDTFRNTFINSGEALGAQFGVYSNAESLSIVNSGTISSLNKNAGVAIFHANSALGETYSLVNSGLVQGDGLSYSGGVDTDIITNTGDMIGGMNLNGGDDIYRGRSGFVEGTIDGGSGADMLIGGDEDNDFLGGDDNDTLRGRGGDDDLEGGSGADTLRGHSGHDTLIGGSNGDDLRGGEGDDTLIGGGGGDTLAGGSDNDTLTGGNGGDVFVFARGAGDDVVTDFDNGADLIDVTAFGLGSVGALAPAIATAGSDTLIDWSVVGGQGLLILEGTAGVINGADFIL
ncbi:MAG: calcium-binding protein [Pseudomonadota bacterium]